MLNVDWPDGQCPAARARWPVPCHQGPVASALPPGPGGQCPATRARWPLPCRQGPVASDLPPGPGGQCPAARARWPVPCHQGPGQCIRIRSQGVRFD
ncbi:hypothetical protein NHX12_020619 [Muraenolepis orangiensis]|uniref:Uncharacterized protein n=1 Tax=Muraenolepis orangiensis TaxID=630683 RepID=A0A9Q0IWJ2_9TELE|nr:hypothetical protein NHX12_020619 [Muraenolepis orangiensis]